MSLSNFWFDSWIELACLAILMERRNKLYRHIQGPNLYSFFFESRNTVVNDEVAKKAIDISANKWFIGIRTDPDPAPRHFYWLSGGPFTSLSFGRWGPK